MRKYFVFVLFLFISFTVSIAQWINDGYGRPRTYDVQHILIKVSFDEKEKTVFGECTTTLQPLNDNFREFELDAIAMKIDYVKDSKGKELKFEKIYNDKGLRIYLEKPLSKKDRITFTIKYSYQPKSGLYFVQPDSINPDRRWQIWTQGQGKSNDNWFPCYNYQNDKTTTETIVTVKDNYTVLSNGKLISVKSDTKNKTKTYHWKTTKPHSTYLVMLGIGEYHIIKDRYKNIPVDYYVYKEQVEDAKRCFKLTPDMIKFYSTVTGYEYPWEKYSQITLNNFMYGGMENTSATTLNDLRAVYDKRTEIDYQNTGLVAHELAHQWYGDLVTAKDGFNHWLQEGFATYFDALYREKLLGRDEFIRIMDENMNAYKADERKQGKIPMYSKVAPFVYVKGASVLNMLRFILGDKDFFKSIKLFTKRFAFNLADTQGLMKAIKDATGKDLSWFFDEWLFKASYPHFKVNYVYDEIEKVIKLNVKQTHQVDSIVPYFRMPIDIEVATIKGKKLHRIEVSKEDETFIIKSEYKPLNVIFDKGNWIVKDLVFEKSLDELIYQLKNADCVYDRKVAAYELSKFAKEDRIFEALYESGLNDKFWWVRIEVADSSVALSNPKGKDLLLKMLEDKKSTVRAEAARNLIYFQDEIVARKLRERINNDSSYFVVGSSIVSLSAIEGEKALDVISNNLNINSFHDIIKHSIITALKIIDTPNSIDILAKLTKFGEKYNIRERAISTLATCKSDAPKVKEILQNLLNDKDIRVRDLAKELLSKI